MNRRRRSGPGEVREQASIDALYGLEPVFEPGSDTAAETAEGLTPFVQVHCPYCGEPFETRLDLSQGAGSCIEDCQVCCQPIEFVTTVDAAGGLLSLTLMRSDRD